VPPCSKEGCPIGHQFSYQNIANLDYICDLCGVSTSVSNHGVYDDTSCNFGICGACYQTLPEHFDPSKPRELIANVPTQCTCGAPLSEVNSIHQLHHCSLCLRERECPKQCKRCFKFYCLKCKMVEIENDDTCGKHEHELVLLNLGNYGQNEQLQNEYGCMCCLRKSEEYYFDKQCRTRLCSECFLEYKRATADKKRSEITKCELNHVLSYLNGPEDTIDVCSSCHEQKIIKLRCYYCEEELGGEARFKSYCFECRPIKLSTCYYKHKLRLAKFQGSRPCQFCCQHNNEFHYCRKCFFYVCRQCMAHNQQLFEQAMQPEEQEEQDEEAKEMKIKGWMPKLEHKVGAMKV
jgi:hypothetical protein